MNSSFTSFPGKEIDWSHSPSDTQLMLGQVLHTASLSKSKTTFHADNDAEHTGLSRKCLGSRWHLVHCFSKKKNLL